MSRTPQSRSAGSEARQRRSDLTMTWVPRRDARGRTYMEARWAPADAVAEGAVSAPRSAA